MSKRAGKDNFLGVLENISWGRFHGFSVWLLAGIEKNGPRISQRTLIRSAVGEFSKT